MLKIKKTDLLRKMKIVYMEEGLNTIRDMIRSKRSRIEAEPASPTPDNPKKKRSCLVRALTEEAPPPPPPQDKSHKNTLHPTKSSKINKKTDSDLIKSKSKKQRKKNDTVKTKPETKPKFEALLKNVPLNERRLMQARNGIPFALNQSCEELPLDFSSVKDYCDKLLNDFSDVNNGERKIMNMWNNYIMHIMGRSFVHVPKLLEDFIHDKGHDIVDQHLFRNAMLMIDSFQDSGILDPVDSYTAKSQLQVQVAEYMRRKLPQYQQPKNKNGFQIGTSLFYGSNSSLSNRTAEEMHSRRSMDDHLPCRRNISPVLSSCASRTLSLDTSIEEERTRISSRNARPRLNSKGGGSPGRGSPVRGSPTSVIVKNPNVDDECSSEGSVFRRTATKKLGGGVGAARKGLWQSEENGRKLKQLKLNSFTPSLDKPKENSRNESTLLCSHATKLLTPGTEVNGSFHGNAHKKTKFKDSSPEAIKKFLAAFDNESYEDLEADLPAFVVVPRTSSKQVTSNENGICSVLSDLHPDCIDYQDVPSSKRCSRSKTN